MSRARVGLEASGLVTVTSVLILAGTVPATAGAQQSASPTTAFVDVAVVPMDRSRVLAHQTVVVQGDRIVALGPAKRAAVPAGATRIPGSGKFLLPGLADMHAHITGVGWTPDTNAAKQAVTRYVASGVTTIRDMWGNPATLVLKGQAASGALLSPRIYASARPAEGGLSHLSDRPAEAVRRAKQAGFDFLKFWDIPQGEELDSILAAARQVGMPIAGHADGLKGDNLRAIKIGYRSVELLLGFWRKEDTTTLGTTAAALQQAGVWVCPTLFGGVDTATLYHAVKVLHDAGVGLLAGTDAAWGPRPGAGHPVTDELVALVAAGLSPYEALATATRNPARYFGTLDSVGTVTVGKRADLLLIAGNPLTDIRQVARQAGVMVRGRWVSRGTLDSLVAGLPT